MKAKVEGRERGEEYCKKVLFPVVLRLRFHIDKIKARLAAGEELTDIHADMAERGETL